MVIVSESARTWRVGELARAAGLSVRALHHYDQLGLLVPSERSLTGYRLYSERDARRLYRIVALRRLGLSLSAIADALGDDRLELWSIVVRQLELVERRQRELGELHRLLAGIRQALEHQHEPSIDQLMRIMEAMSAYEKYLSADQLERLRQRGAGLGPEAIEEAQREWRELFAVLRVEMEAGTDPADPRLDAHHERARTLLRAFTGGESDIEKAMRRMWNKEDPELVSQGMVDRELWEYGAKVSRLRGGMLSS